MKLKSKDFRKNRFFVLYDYDDNIVLFIDSTKELLHIYGQQVRNIVYKFNTALEDYIPVIVDGKKYKLYTFTD